MKKKKHDPEIELCKILRDDSITSFSA